jgi:hypothetical protein
MPYTSSCGYCSSASPSFSGSQLQYSSLESAVSSGYSGGSSNTMDYNPPIRMSAEQAGSAASNAVSSAEHGQANSSAYTAKKNQMYSSGMYLGNASKPGYVFMPQQFLNDVPTEFISSDDDSGKSFVSGLIEEAFKATTGKEMPNDIAIRICSSADFRKIHESLGGKWSPGIMGFSINKRGFGKSEVFVKEDELARLMLTVGHEIGHVISLPMGNAVDEEAKAFAFSMAWMNAIKDNNIGGLSGAINPSPAKNGIHNVAFDFIVELMEKGRRAIDVYLDLIRGEVSINNRISV